MNSEISPDNLSSACGLDSADAVVELLERGERCKFETRRNLAIILSGIVSLGIVVGATFESDYYTSSKKNAEIQKLLNDGDIDDEGRQEELKERSLRATNMVSALDSYKSELRELIDANGGVIPKDFDYCDFFVRTDFLVGGVSESELSFARNNFPQVDRGSFLDSINKLNSDLRLITGDDSRTFLTDVLNEKGRNCEASAAYIVCGVQGLDGEVELQDYNSFVDGESIRHRRVLFTDPQTKQTYIVDANYSEVRRLTSDDLSCSVTFSPDQLVRNFLGEQSEYKYYPCDETNEVGFVQRKIVRSDSNIVMNGMPNFSGVKIEEGENPVDKAKVFADIKIVFVENQLAKIKQAPNPLEIVKGRSDVSRLIFDQYTSYNDETITYVLNYIDRGLANVATIVVSDPKFPFEKIRSLLGSSLFLNLSQIDKFEDFSKILGLVAQFKSIHVKLSFSQKQIAWLEAYDFAGCNGIKDLELDGPVSQRLIDKIGKLKNLNYLSVKNSSDIDLNFAGLNVLSLDVKGGKRVIGIDRMQRVKSLNLSGIEEDIECDLSRNSQIKELYGNSVGLDCLESLPVGELKYFSYHNMDNDSQSYKKLLAKHQNKLERVVLSFDQWLLDSDFSKLLKDKPNLHYISIVLERNQVKDDLIKRFVKKVEKDLGYKYTHHFKMDDGSYNYTFALASLISY